MTHVRMCVLWLHDCCREWEEWARNRLTISVGSLLILQLTVLSRSAITALSNILMKFLFCHFAFWIFRLCRRCCHSLKTILFLCEINNKDEIKVGVCSKVCRFNMIMLKFIFRTDNVHVNFPNYENKFSQPRGVLLIHINIDIVYLKS